MVWVYFLNFQTDLLVIFTARDQRPVFFGGAESMERTVNSLFVTKYGRGTSIFSAYIFIRQYAVVLTS